MTKIAYYDSDDVELVHKDELHALRGHAVDLQSLRAEMIRAAVSHQMELHDRGRSHAEDMRRLRAQHAADQEAIVASCNGSIAEYQKRISELERALAEREAARPIESEADGSGDVLPPSEGETSAEWSPEKPIEPE